MAAATITARGGRSIRERSPRSRAADPLLRFTLTGLAGLILVLIAFFFVRLFVEAKPAFDQFGYAGSSSTTTGTSRRRSSAPGRWWSGRS